MLEGWPLLLANILEFVKKIIPTYLHFPILKHIRNDQDESKQLIYVHQDVMILAFNLIYIVIFTKGQSWPMELLWNNSKENKEKGKSHPKGKKLKEEKIKGN